eukprot:scaffold7626_cov55-Phaeocystis_antarctica.AAC.3
MGAVESERTGTSTAVRFRRGWPTATIGQKSSPEIVGAHHHDSTLGTPQQAPSPGSSVTPPTVYPVGFSSGTPVPSRETPVPSRARVEKAPCWLPLTDRQTQETRLAKALSAVAQIVRDTRGL